MKNTDVLGLKNIQTISTMSDFSDTINRINASFIANTEMPTFSAKMFQESLINITKNLALTIDLKGISDALKIFSDSLKDIRVRSGWHNIPVIDTDYIKSILESYELPKVENGYIVNKDKSKNKDLDEYLLTYEQIEDIKKDITTVINDKLDEKVIQDCNIKWNEKHPILSQIFIGIILIMIEMLINMAKDSIMSTSSSKVNIYMEGSNNSAIIYTLSENSDVTIIDNSKSYYYKILHTDIENNVDIEGYVAKRNLKPKSQREINK